ncbi:ABC transporter ATP-binding protein [Candidatus Halocynthiibacter alkanivorans]|uniref:ABC transporter ATP-binding protein n=1 Tax=Candidatus Halocynthiibacter alkanivorans TaxID=2267619 RepID=UPI000DF24C42|nr:sn-glycerol-3-phosphate ABC transporter ATP-binding protein UgpC [Candidatus Halocynthiibacter alkanivorans]
MAALTIENLKKSYGSVKVLKGIDLDIEDGGFLVLVGPSGCGKSTLLNTIAGLEEISGGDIKIGGVSVDGLHPSKRDIAMVFQSYALYPNMTVAKNISFGMEIRGLPKSEIMATINEVAALLQIEDLLGRKPSQLSGGQRQRVAMGRALVRDPQVFLFDEPLSNLDAKLRVDMRTEIKRLHQRLKTTIVYVTHDQIEALTLATKIAVLKDGCLQQAGTPDEIYNNPANMFVASFMGSPSMNLMRAKVSEEAGQFTIEITSGAATALTLPVNGIADLQAYVGKSVMFGIRPEALTDPDGSDKKHGAEIVTRAAVIEVVEPAGSDTFAVARLGGIEAVARLRADAEVEAGQTSSLAFNMTKAVFFDPETELRIR